MEDACDRCIAILQLQGLVAAASFAVCLFTWCKLRHCCDLTESLQQDESSDNMCTSSATTPNKSAVSSAVYAADDMALVEHLLRLRSETASADIRRKIGKHANAYADKTEQCNSALSYEFAGIYGSDKVQQADASRILSALGKIANLRHMDMLVLLKGIDPLVLKAFEPLTVLSVLCIMLAEGGAPEPADILTFFTEHEIDIPTALGAATTINCLIGRSNISASEVMEAVDAVNSAAVRRSSRIRRIKKSP
ncbi:hypothetical protein BBBOND_0400710 [Babesia bigemina]|uniref:Uncharacterized protein n=1 Tax=Babesia bigemina TaxID=5866 RepID=A0A061DDP1_BABBI|nr:hypothetical protein BBBOND_0400710 [Babesia bigemina]CDR97579.1 hypothetical protein BBBOND_0400710 [Babesia bigemina]|eukprot:XP_012769765.1 hypothetical protein BBBOND_0400710 [Babesia bigemina]